QATKVQVIVDEAFGICNLDNEQISQALNFISEVLKDIISLDIKESIEDAICPLSY
ncbi:29359_t:CDS:1, partial [Gigaspora margarita]